MSNETLLTDDVWLSAAEIGETLKRMRLGAGWTQAEMAAELGIPGSQSQVSLWERGKQRPSLATLRAYAQMAGYSLEELFMSDRGRANMAAIRGRIRELKPKGSAATSHLDVIGRVEEMRRFEGVPGIGTQVGMVLSYAESEEWSRDELLEALQRIQGWAAKAEVELSDLRAEIRRRDRESDEPGGA